MGAYKKYKKIQATEKYTPTNSMIHARTHTHKEWANVHPFIHI